MFRFLRSSLPQRRESDPKEYNASTSALEISERESQVQFLIKGYDLSATRYENLYKAVWTNFSYLAALSGGLLVFGANRLDTVFALLIACVPLLFWYRASFEPLDRYGDDVGFSLSELEKRINALAFAGEPFRDHDLARPGLDQWSKFSERGPTATWPEGSRESGKWAAGWRWVLITLGVPTKHELYRTYKDPRQESDKTDSATETSAREWDGPPKWRARLYEGPFWIAPRVRNRVRIFGAALHLIALGLFVTWISPAVRSAFNDDPFKWPDVVAISPNSSKAVQIDPASRLQLPIQPDSAASAALQQRLNAVEAKLDTLLLRQ